ncbi:HET domain-containing protein [Colletotrichum kahawae]|uniref:HET domain-containing protein n=1 Tax=Colletotrichum kahawae TaxID=34407 RepID=A0AAD9YRW1_COLKA|nr:HET domain-containing protein [Colletotrichum kahawae]
MIYTTEDSFEAPKYAALSYCWGSVGQSLVLTEKNLQEWSYEGICTDLLPATIRDAITVTHSLGILYLWVDSMCIVQDAREDKERELKKIHLVYENCYVAICVANRESGDGFLDQTTNHVCGKPFGFQFACTLPDGQTGTLIVSITEHFQPKEDKINQRAWTLQERLLAPRTLYYTNDPSLLYWDCSSLFERHDSQNSADLESARSHEWSMGRLRAEVAAPKHHREEESSTFDDELIDKVMLEWKQVVCDYSKRLISHDEDRLDAMASLAAKFQTALPPDYTYVAGMWLDPAQGYRQFIHALYWAVCRGEARPTSEYVSPSWSWASVHGEIRGEPDWPGWGTSKEPQCTVIDHHWELTSLELPYGRVRPGAWLRLEGYLSPVVLKLRDGGQTGTLREMGSMRAYSGGFSVDGDFTEEKEIIIWYFILFDSQGLLLERLEGVSDDMFKKIGTARLFGDDLRNQKSFATVVIV